MACLRVVLAPTYTVDKWLGVNVCSIHHLGESKLKPSIPTINSPFLQAIKLKSPPKYVPSICVLNGHAHRFLLGHIPIFECPILHLTRIVSDTRVHLVFHAVNGHLQYSVSVPLVLQPKVQLPWYVDSTQSTTCCSQPRGTDT